MTPDEIAHVIPYEVADLTRDEIARVTSYVIADMIARRKPGAHTA